MEIFRHIRQLWQARGLLFLLYAVKAVAALVTVMPIYLTVNSLLAHSSFSRTLLSGWDMSVLLEIFIRREELFSMSLAVVITAAVIYLVLMQFINGGLYFAVVSGKTREMEWGEFLTECGRNFNNHMKITLVMLPVYILLFMAAVFFVGMIGLAGGDMVGTPALILNLLKVIIIYLILLAASLFSDSARATLAAFPDHSFREILKIAADYYRPRVARLTRLFLLTFLPFLMIWMIIEWLTTTIVGNWGGTVGLILEFLLFQVAAYLRSGQKLWFLIFLGKDFRSNREGRFVPEQVEMKLG